MMTTYSSVVVPAVFPPGAFASADVVPAQLRMIVLAIVLSAAHSAPPFSEVVPTHFRVFVSTSLGRFYVLAPSYDVFGADDVAFIWSWYVLKTRVTSMGRSFTGSLLY